MRCSPAGRLPGDDVRMLASISGRDIVLVGAGREDGQVVRMKTIKLQRNVVLMRAVRRIRYAVLVARHAPGSSHCGYAHPSP